MRNQNEHPVSYNLTESQLDSLREDYMSRGEDFLINLDIKWDLKTSFNQYHDVDAELTVRIVSKQLMLKGLIHGVEYHSYDIFWDPFGDKRKRAGVIYSIQNGVSLTPPIVTASDCSTVSSFFVHSGHNRFAVGWINKEESMPLLIKSTDIESFEESSDLF